MTTHFTPNGLSDLDTTNTQSARLETTGLRVPRGRTTLIAAAVVASFTFSACGAIAEKAIEETAERALEAESGENVEIDFDDDGSFSVQSEDGSFSVDDDGNIVVTGEDGEVFTGNVDAEDGNITIEGEDGEQVLNVDVDENGDTAEITFEGEDGEDGSFKTVTQIPDEWPSDVPRPDGINDINGTVITGEGQTMVSVAGTASNSGQFADAYGDALSAAGFNQTGKFESEGDISANYENGSWSVNVIAVGDDNMVSITLFPLD